MENREEIKKRIQFLTGEILRHQDLYYKNSKPEISDREYDALFDELLSLEKRYPEFTYPESPTKRVGSDLDNKFPEVPHPLPMLSLDKVYGQKDLMEWIDKAGREVERELSFVIEEKIDGSTIVLHYEDGILSKAVTRGDGFVGNEITENVQTIRDIPLKLTQPVTSIFRGEIYLNTSDFEALNREMDNIYANPRNFAAGSLRRKKSSEVAKIPLRSTVYEGFLGESRVTEHIVMLDMLSELGFRVGRSIGFFFPAGIDENNRPVFDRHRNWVHGSFKEIDDFIESRMGERDKLDYEIDGLVVKVNEYPAREKLGFTSHHLKWAIAYKFEAPQAVSEIMEIEVQVGRTGRVTPVARIAPVRISGTTVSNVTLHNQDYISSLDIAIGDRVSVSRRGDVIPAVEEVVEKNDWGNKTFVYPIVCPVCNSNLIQDGAHHFCPNRNCPARVYGRMTFFVARGQMDIENLGPETIKRLMDLGLVKDIPDIYTFDPDGLFKKKGFAEKKVSLIREGIEKSRSRTYASVLASLGLDEIGPNVVELLIKAGYDSIEKLIGDAGKRDSTLFMRIPGIGPKIAERIIQHFNDPEVLEMIVRLKKAGLSFSEQRGKEEERELPKIFEGEIWCVTGSFEKFTPRDLAMEEVKKRGGKVTSSVTGKTTHLLVGKEPGSKFEKAKGHGIRIVTEDEFLRMIKGEKV